MTDNSYKLVIVISSGDSSKSYLLDKDYMRIGASATAHIKLPNLTGLADAIINVNRVSSKVSISLNGKPQTWEPNRSIEFGPYRLKLIFEQDLKSQKSTEDINATAEGENKDTLEQTTLSQQAQNYIAVHLSMQDRNTQVVTDNGTITERDIGFRIAPSFEQSLIRVGDIAAYTEAIAAMHLRGVGLFIENRSDQGIAVLCNGEELFLREVTQYQRIETGDKFIVGSYIFTVENIENTIRLRSDRYNDPSDLSD